VVTFAQNVVPLGLLLAALIVSADEKPFDPGPVVGASLPAFEAVDQEGHSRTFASLRGPKGLVLVFFRSADW
jgi:hypothetical protein